MLPLVVDGRDLCLGGALLSTLSKHLVSELGILSLKSGLSVGLSGGDLNSICLSFGICLVSGRDTCLFSDILCLSDLLSMGMVGKCLSAGTGACLVSLGKGCLSIRSLGIGICLSCLLSNCELVKCLSTGIGTVLSGIGIGACLSCLSF